MSMKKAGRILALMFAGLIMLSFMAGVVSALDTVDQDIQTAGDQLGEFFTGVIDGIQKAGEPVFRALLGGVTQGGDLFTKVLLFLLVVFVIVAVLEFVPFFTGKKWLIWLSAIVIATFGIRYIPSGFVETITIPSSALALTIGLGLPFLIFFFIIQKVDNSYVRRAGWAVFASMILFLWFYNLNNPALDHFRWIYLVTIGICIISFWFDGTLQNWLGAAKRQRELERTTDIQRNRIIAEIRDLQGALATATGNNAKKIQGQIESKKEALKNL